MAKALVNSLASAWEPGKYTDQYRENLLRVINAKLKGRQPKLSAGEEPRQAEVVDLMERLRQSLAKHAPARGGEKRASKTAARRHQKPHGRRAKPAA